MELQVRSFSLPTVLCTALSTHLTVFIHSKGRPPLEPVEDTEDRGQEVKSEDDKICHFFQLYLSEIDLIMRALSLESEL